MTTSGNRPHALYRFYNHADQLLYVGITLNPGNRWAKHAHTKPWWHDVARITLELHPDRAAVLTAEQAAIETEHPAHNIVHNRRRTRPHAVTISRTQPPPPADDELAAEMIDDCHDICVPTGRLAVYLPYRWRSNGQAFYQCAAGHRWTCWWGFITAHGEAPQFRGAPVVVLNPGAPA